MKPGDTTIVYANPLTHDQPEGEAKLIKRLRVDEGIKDFAFWEVEFTEEPSSIYERWIYPS